MKQQSEQTDCGLDDGVQHQWIAQPLAISADEERADRHSAEEDREHEDLGVRAVADQQREVACPDRFVNEASGARQEKERVERELDQRTLERRWASKIAPLLPHGNQPASIALCNSSSGSRQLRTPFTSG